MTLVYEGGAKGRLMVKADFGEADLPATREEREAMDNGERYTAIGIGAFGSATIRMPELA